MNLGAQYYRPPFPNRQHWDDDLRRMREAGLNTVQLWVLWSWVESVPGRFNFDDYDRLVELAGTHGLGVVLSTIAEIQPLWIHREVPDCELVMWDGRKVVSCTRNETHFGLTPGGCTDHPEVWRRMAGFLQAVGERYKSAGNLRGWDAWNELRWCVQAPDRVCYCPHTIEAFRAWLEEKHGGLDGLNAAWQRRYGSWNEVDPGIKFNQPFTENMAFCHFLTHRACEHGKARYKVLKGIDPDRPVTVHGGAPSPQYCGGPTEHALNRGNDWFFADTLDGVGTSSFPKWGGIDDADFGMRIEFVTSAARGKRVWLSELQGGRAARGFSLFDPVDALSQQRWIWNGVACGADTVLFWCWRDEVFTTEAAGFGLIGLDGHAEERLEAMRVTGRVMEEHADLLAGYAPDTAEVGLLFSPQSFYLNWSIEGTGRRSRDALFGYARALIRTSIPYVVVEEEHLHALDGLKMLVLPRALVTGPKLEAALERFVRNGGTLLCESECGAFSPAGIYRTPAERFTARLAGRCEVGRRAATGAEEGLAVRIGDRTFAVDVTDQWFTPWGPGEGETFAANDQGALLAEAPCGEGRLVHAGAYLGEAYTAKRYGGLERLLEALARRAGCRRPIDILSPEPTPGSFLYVKSGTSRGRRMLFVFFQPGQTEAHLRLAAGAVRGDRMTDLITGDTHALAPNDDGTADVRLTPPPWRFAVLVSDAD